MFRGSTGGKDIAQLSGTSPSKSRNDIEIDQPIEKRTLVSETHGEKTNVNSSIVDIKSNINSAGGTTSLRYQSRANLNSQGHDGTSNGILKSTNKVRPNGSAYNTMNRALQRTQGASQVSWNFNTAVTSNRAQI